MDTKNKIFTVVGSIAIISAAGIGGYWLFSTPDTLPVATTSSTKSVVATTASDTSTATSTTAPSSIYKDGTYTATVNYNVPQGERNGLTAEVTVASGAIVAVKVSNTYSNEESRFYIEDFNGRVELNAKGQSIASYLPSRIGGASLTTQAFDSVLDAVRTDAKA